nr:uncharacterized protein LOC113816114 [Penaeus vannamei]
MHLGPPPTLPGRGDTVLVRLDPRCRQEAAGLARRENDATTRCYGRDLETPPGGATDGGTRAVALCDCWNTGRREGFGFPRDSFAPENVFALSLQPKRMGSAVLGSHHRKRRFSSQD